MQNNTPSQVPTAGHQKAKQASPQLSVFLPLLDPTINPVEFVLA